MQSHYPPSFVREMGCTEPDLLRWLPGAVGTAALALQPGAAQATLGAGGRLHLAWQVLPPRRIALATLPRLHIEFRFDAVSDEARHAFMRHFDLYMMRGGG